MTEKFPIATAKKADELAGTYAKVKTLAKDFGFAKIAEMKDEVVKKAMTDSKKPAEFIVEVETDKTMIVQLVCDVKGKMRSVLGRSEIRTAKDYTSAKALASNASLKKTAAEMFAG